QQGVGISFDSVYPDHNGLQQQIDAEQPIDAGDGGLEQAGDVAQTVLAGDHQRRVDHDLQSYDSRLLEAGAQLGADWLGPGDREAADGLELGLRRLGLVRLGLVWLWLV